MNELEGSQATNGSTVITPPPTSGQSDWLIFLGLLGGSFILCSVGGALARYVWLIGVVVVSYWAWKRSATFHLQTVMIIFAVAPLLRRMVDVNAGFEASGMMLAAPLLALIMPATDLLRRNAVPCKIGPAGRPFLLALLCISYGIAVTALIGDIKAAVTGVLKLIPPVVYGLYLVRYVRLEPQLVPSLARTMLLILMPLSLYGIAQFIFPEPWDRYWMINSRSTIWSIGTPEPYKVRVFSTMASPASFATLTICGCLLLSGADWRSRKYISTALLIVAGVPIIGALLLTTYRTSWTALAAGIGFLTLFSATRIRGLQYIGFAAAAIVAAGTLHLSDGVVSRLQTFGQAPGSDESAVDRLQQLRNVYESSDNLLIGRGYTAIFPVNPFSAVDGTIVECQLVMGVAVGSILLLSIVWAAAQGIIGAVRDGSRWKVSLGAVNIASLVLMPLASVLGNELGFLFWTFAGLAAGLGKIEVGATADEINHARFSTRVFSMLPETASASFRKQM
jgi:hypothetical protein